LSITFAAFKIRAYIGSKDIEILEPKGEAVSHESATRRLAAATPGPWLRVNAELIAYAPTDLAAALAVIEVATRLFPEGSPILDDSGSVSMTLAQWNDMREVLSEFEMLP
jgi:hypothetical protein